MKKRTINNKTAILAVFTLMTFGSRAERLLWQTEIPHATDWRSDTLGVYASDYGVCATWQTMAGDTLTLEAAWLSRDGKLLHQGTGYLGKPLIPHPRRILFMNVLIEGGIYYTMWTATDLGVVEKVFVGFTARTDPQHDSSRYYTTTRLSDRIYVECWQFDPVLDDPDSYGDATRVPLTVESSATANGPWKRVGTATVPATSQVELYRLRIGHPQTSPEARIIYWGSSAQPRLTTGEQIKALGSRSAAFKPNGNYEFSETSSPLYVYIAWPQAYGPPAGGMGFRLGGFSASMAYESDGYGIVNLNGYWADIVDVEGTPYYVFRLHQATAGPFYLQCTGDGE